MGYKMDSIGYLLVGFHLPGRPIEIGLKLSIQQFPILYVCTVQKLGHGHRAFVNPLVRTHTVKPLKSSQLK